MNKEDKKCLYELIEKHINDQLSDSESLKLQDIVIASEEAQTIYVDALDQHSRMLDLSDKITLNTDQKQPTSNTNLFYKVIALAALLALAFTVLNPRTVEQNHIATISKTENSRWGNSSLPTNEGSKLSAGQLTLEEGLVNLEFTSGAKLTIEAPATIELVDNMYCKIHSGTALVSIPESAQGFKIITPTASAIDHGTEFLVSYDPSSKQSLVDVLDGEVEVATLNSKSSKRFFTGESVYVNQQKLSKQNKANEVLSSTTKQIDKDVLTISTEYGSGDDAYITKTKIKGHNSNSLLMVKKSETDFKRKAYLKFDLRNQELKEYKTAKLKLALQASGYGFAALVPDSSFSVYALTNDDLDDWQHSSISWQNAPANTDNNELDYTLLTKIGTFSVPKGKYTDIVTLNSSTLSQHIKEDKNKIVSLIIIRNTGEFSPHGLVHAFASKRHPDAMAPTLEFSKD
ncbi:MAG: DNRLRE domain-containing protein [Lentisphaeraceae bacterium]|nr:DNRLRE domain-containing protein [Lentisphaeraceae bacterium]